MEVVAGFDCRWRERNSEEEIELLWMKRLKSEMVRMREKDSEMNKKLNCVRYDMKNKKWDVGWIVKWIQTHYPLHVNSNSLKEYGIKCGFVFWVVFIFLTLTESLDRIRTSNSWLFALKTWETTKIYIYIWNDKFVIILIAFRPEGIFLSLMQQLHAFFY